MTTTLYVCTTCRAGQTLEDHEVRPGTILHEALKEEGVAQGVNLVGVKCLSACSRGPAIALSEPGKWSYVYGSLEPADVPEILEGAALYAASADGVVPWRERPETFRKNSVARIPPFLTPSEAQT